jgi:hypothetical protein
MSSRFLCDCGERIDTNMFSGNGTALLVSEVMLEHDLSGVSAEEFVQELILKTQKVVTCRNCDRLYILHKSLGSPIRVYRCERVGCRQDTD